MKVKWQLIYYFTWGDDLKYLYLFDKADVDAFLKLKIGLAGKKKGV